MWNRATGVPQHHYHKDNDTVTAVHHTKVPNCTAAHNLVHNSHHTNTPILWLPQRPLLSSTTFELPSGSNFVTQNLSIRFVAEEIISWEVLFPWFPLKILHFTADDSDCHQYHSRSPPINDTSEEGFARSREVKDASDRTVQDVCNLAPLEHLDHGFESHSKHRCVPAFLCFVILCTRTAMACLPSKESYQMLKRIRFVR
jgi:hypothetical protein